MSKSPTISPLESPNWEDYALLDSGEGLKLERFGPYTFIRPEVQAMWPRALTEKEWDVAHAVFQPTREESGGHWQFKKRVEDKWKMQYGSLTFWTMTTPGRHLGVFPECAANWDWTIERITNCREREESREERKSSAVKILNLFGYTGLATLAAAAAGAQVTHVDASKKSVSWARENQVLSGLEDNPIRWIVDDALKFVLREGRRGNKYDGILLDPPKFGRGPKGEVWEIYKSLPNLLEACRQVLSDQPLFVIATVYAVQASAIHVGQALEAMMSDFEGSVGCGELMTREKSAGRLLSHAVFARWSGV